MKIQINLSKDLAECCRVVAARTGMWASNSLKRLVDN
jgi:hypothetical protein